MLINLQLTTGSHAPTRTEHEYGGASFDAARQSRVAAILAALTAMMPTLMKMFPSLSRMFGGPDEESAHQDGVQHGLFRAATIASDRLDDLLATLDGASQSESADVAAFAKQAAIELRNAIGRQPDPGE